jgi:hypothetical protein
MDKEKPMTSAQIVTKTCYTEETRNLTFRIECESLGDLKECVRIIDSYNNFDADTVIKALEKFADTRVYYSEGNGNNGRNLLRFDIGREGSPVMYIKYPEFGVHTVEEGDKTFEYTKDMFKKDMEKLAEEVMADECDFSVGSVSYDECRLWWD